MGVFHGVSASFFPAKQNTFLGLGMELLKWLRVSSSLVCDYAVACAINCFRTGHRCLATSYLTVRGNHFSMLAGVRSRMRCWGLALGLFTVGTTACAAVVVTVTVGRG